MREQCVCVQGKKARLWLPGVWASQPELEALEFGQKILDRVPGGC